MYCGVVTLLLVVCAGLFAFPGMLPGILFLFAQYCYSESQTICSGLVTQTHIKIFNAKDLLLYYRYDMFLLQVLEVIFLGLHGSPFSSTNT